MEEHFILRVPQSVAERLERVLNEDPEAANDINLDLAFQGQRFPIQFTCDVRKLKGNSNGIHICSIFMQGYQMDIRAPGGSGLKH